MKSFSKMTRGLALSIVAAAALGSMEGCTRIETGSVGILKHWDGEISTKAQTGVVMTVMDSVIGHIDTTETRMKLDNMHPADSRGNQLADLDLVLSVRLNGEKVPTFYINTKELDVYVDESGRSVTTVGLNVVKNIASHAVNEVTKLKQMSELSGSIPDYEKQILGQVQKELDAGYPGVFQVVRVNVNKMTLPEGVAKQAQAMANLDMEAARIDKELALTQKRQEVAKQSALIDGQALASAVAATKLSPEQLIAWKNAKSYGEQAVAMGTKAAPVVSAQQPNAGK